MSRIGRFTDKVIGVFAPKRAAIRGHFRRMESDREYRDTVLALLNACDGRAVGSKWGLSFEGSWAFRLKDRIDRRVVEQNPFRACPENIALGDDSDHLPRPLLGEHDQ